jgi:hypothetical protein
MEIILLANIYMDCLKVTASIHGRMETRLVDSLDKEKSTDTGFGRNQAPIQTPTTIRVSI